MRQKIIISFLLIPLPALLMSVTCSTPEPTHTTYEDEIRRFVLESEDGVELYATQIYPEDPFYLDDTLQVLYMFGSSERVITVNISSSPRDIYGFNSVYDAVATISDNLSGGLYKIIPGDTVLLYDAEVRLRRYTYFLKLYADDYEYHGWRFWGYSSDGASDTLFGAFTSASGKTFTALPSDSLPDSHLGSYFILKNDIPILPKGDSLTYSSQTQDRIFTETGDGIVKGLNTALNGTIYTVGWRIPSAGSRFFHLITLAGPWTLDIDTLFSDTVVIRVDTTILKLDDLVLPYKLGI